MGRLDLIGNGPGCLVPGQAGQQAPKEKSLPVQPASRKKRNSREKTKTGRNPHRQGSQNKRGGKKGR